MIELQISDWLEKKKTLYYGNRALKKINKLPQEIKDNTIILIGPMGAGKSSTSKVLRDIRNMERISLDSKHRLSNIYKYKRRFKNFKNFEFCLTCSVLASLKKPMIIDFGSGHSIYEDKEIFELMKRVCSNFKNVFLLLPTQNSMNPDGSIDTSNNSRILSLRILEDNGRPWEGNLNFERKVSQNNHNLRSHCNYDLATKIIYQNDRSVEQVAIIIDNEMNKINNKEREEENEK